MEIKKRVCVKSGSVLLCAVCLLCAKTALGQPEMPPSGQAAPGAPVSAEKAPSVAPPDKTSLIPPASPMIPGMPPSMPGVSADVPAPETPDVHDAKKPADKKDKKAKGKKAAGPETVEFPEEEIGVQGNWIKKREWLKEAYKLNTKVQEMVVSIQKARKGYYDKYVEVDDELDKFYQSEGIEQGKVESLFDDLFAYIAKQKRKEVKKLKLSKKELGITTEYQIKLDAVDEKAKSLRIDLEQLKLDVKSIWDLDKSLDARLKKVDEQIGVALEESSRSRDLLEKMWYIIDDKKAETAFYQLKGEVFAKVQSLQTYIQKDLAQDFDAVLKIIRDQISRVKSEVQDLENKRLIIRNRAERLRTLKQKKLEEAKREEEAIEKIERKVKPEMLSWYQRVSNVVIDSFARAYNWIRGLFGGAEKKPVKKEAKKARKKVARERPIAAKPAAPAKKEAEPSKPASSTKEEKLDIVPQMPGVSASLSSSTAPVVPSVAVAPPPPVAAASNVSATATGTGASLPMPS